MLSVHDREVVSRDPALPGLFLLLDDEALLEWLQRNPPEGDGWADVPEEVTCRYLRYKPGVRLVGAFEMRTASGYTLPFKAWTVAEGGRDKLEKAIRELPPAFAPARRWCRTLRVMVQFHPDDRDLPNLARLADPGTREALLSRRLPELAGRFGGPLRILSYRPERRFVAALSRQGEPAAVVRGYTADRFSRSLGGARAFRTTRGGFRIPRLLGESRGAAILIQEWLLGTPQGVDCWGLKTPAEAAVVADRIGRALHGMHGQGARSLRRPECSGLSGAVAGVESVRPGDTARAARRVARWLRPLLPGWEGPPPPLVAPIHGDFHPGQILVSGDALALVDFDHAALGDPLRDLATFVAHLESGSAEGLIPEAVCAAAERGLLEGYREAGGAVDPERFQWQCAAALIRRAPHPFRSRAPEWPAATDALVARASARLSHQGRGFHALP
jgi:hypothetical protein